jgi:hypothetical protein
MPRRAIESSPVELVWEAPLERTNFGMYEEHLPKVQERPGSWARLRTFGKDQSAHSAAGPLKRKLARLDPRWEVKVAKLEGDDYGLYLRYRTQEQMKAAGRK